MVFLLKVRVSRFLRAFAKVVVDFVGFFLTK